MLTDKRYKRKSGREKKEVFARSLAFCGAAEKRHNKPFIVVCVTGLTLALNHNSMVYFSLPSLFGN